MKVLIPTAYYILGLIFGGSLMYKFKVLPARHEYRVLKALYTNLGQLTDRQLGAAYESGFNAGYLVDDLEQEYEEQELAKEERQIRHEEQWVEVSAAIEEWKKDPEMTLKFYPMVNRPWGRD